MTASEITIVGFAPSWEETPWENAGELWGMNALHKIAPDKPWNVWFQLHDIDVAHPHDKEEHLAWLIESGLPVYMFEEHLAKYPIPNGVPFPRQAVMDALGTSYFTNTVSWMVGLAIIQGRQKINIYGIDMAQDGEYEKQRPSCEYLIGLAQGRGIDVYLPDSSDLLKTPFLYGIEEEKRSVMGIKFDARIKDLQNRLAQMQQNQAQQQAAIHQLQGAVEDAQYWRRTWFHD